MAPRTPPRDPAERADVAPSPGGRSPQDHAGDEPNPAHLPDTTSDPGLMGGVDEANEDDDELEAEPSGPGVAGGKKPH